MATSVFLQHFPPSQLIFDDAETRGLLQFFFKADWQLIGGLSMTDELRNFAQGLLVEAVDASSGMGYVEALFRATANPMAGIRKVFAKFARRAARQWFKHATEKDLLDIRVYEMVRSRLALNFRSVLLLFASGLALNKRFGAVVAYPTFASSPEVWSRG
jgi:hypothetical protein